MHSLFDFSVYKIVVETSDGSHAPFSTTREDDRFQVRLTAPQSVRLRSARLHLPFEYEPNDRLMLNGYQSWTETREFTLNEKPSPPFRLTESLFRPYGDYAFAPQGFRSFSWAYIRRNEDYFFMGACDETGGYLIIEYLPEKNEIIFHKDCEHADFLPNALLFDIYFEKGTNYEIIFENYLKKWRLPPLLAPPLTGWTSWYYHYVSINEQIILDNLSTFEKFPIDLFQIDDGWQSAVGDWLSANKKFPNGLKKIADAIHAWGFKAGLWLAPFVCEQKSEIYRNRPNFLLRNKDGAPVRAGVNPLWGGLRRLSFFALDVRNPDVQTYLIRVLKTILHEWGFDLVKLDFLYAATLAPDRNRADEMWFAMDFLREHVGQKWILACGVPLSSAMGRVDYCRIGADVSLSWDTPLLARLGARERLSTASSLRSTIYRRGLNGRAFWNDPDVFLLRFEKNSLTPFQRDTLTILNLIFGGIVLTSDNPQKYAPQTALRFAALFPHVSPPKTRVTEINESLYRIDGEINGFRYLVYANLSSKNVTIIPPSGLYFETLKENFVYFDGQTGRTISGYETVVYFVTDVEADVSFGGSAPRLFPGSEITSFEVTENRVTLTVAPETPPGRIFILVSLKFETIIVNGQNYEINKNVLSILQEKNRGIAIINALNYK